MNTVPSREDLIEALRDLQKDLRRLSVYDPVDVRLQVTEGGWVVRWGDPSFDLDHYGYWGWDQIQADDPDEALREIAIALIDEVESEIGEGCES